MSLLSLGPKPGVPAVTVEERRGGEERRWRYSTMRTLWATKIT
jgi:hypothetical protein